MKTCTKCGETKALTEFHKKKASRDGLRTQCKSCRNVIQKAYCKANPEKVKAGQKAWRETNKEKIKVYRNSPRRKFSSYKGDAKQRNIPFLIEYKQFEGFWQAPCAYCGAEIETIGLDRIDSDGPYHIDNVVPCCWPCNHNKGTQTLEEWTEITLARAKRLCPEEFNK